jgi:hypothetical protein
VRRLPARDTFVCPCRLACTLEEGGTAALKDEDEGGGRCSDSLTTRISAGKAGGKGATDRPYEMPRPKQDGPPEGGFGPIRSE